MPYLFTILFVASIVCLILGLASPEIFKRIFKKNANRKTIGIAFGTAIFVFLILIGVTAPKVEPKPKDNNDNKTAASNENKSTMENIVPVQTTESKTENTTPKPTYIFDVPFLVGKNIDEIRQILGTPLDKDLTEPTAQQIELGGSEWDNSYKKDGQDLLITFDASSRKIIDFFLDGDDKSKLLEIGNLKENASSYTIEPVKAIKDPSVITGIKIIPN